MAKKKKKQEKKEVFYVGVQDPVEVRRNVLETSKDMVQFLQQHEKLKAVRDEKTEAIKHLKEDVKELKTLINKLRRALPKTKLRIKIHEEHEVFKCGECEKEFKSKAGLQKHKKTHKKKTKKGSKKSAKKSAPKKEAPKIKESQASLVAPAETRKPMSEIEKLESELADIENKLGRLE